ncbi:MAG: patatin-like phospholipase family protein [Clostridia bacterium]|nr:patatin-like phospholipase family protein [Clostridia bacterium]
MNLYLSGGGIKGACHIGVLQALEEENIKIESISGVSSGSIIATLYAIGYRPNEIYEIFKKYAKSIKYIEMRNIFKLIKGLIVKREFNIKGLNSGEKLEKLIKEYCLKKNIKNISDIKMDLLIPSIELYDGKIYIFTSSKKRNGYSDEIVYNNDMEIEKVVRASCSYPGIFEPYKVGEKEFIDGGIRGNILCRELKENGIDKIIGVIFNREITKDSNKNIIDVVTNSISLLSYELSKREKHNFDYIIDIKTEKISLLDVSKIEYLYDLGYYMTKKRISEIKSLF